MTAEDEEQIRDIALFHHRRYFDDGGDAITQLHALARKQGIRVKALCLPGCMEFRAVAVELKNGHWYIVYNTAQPYELQAHYLAHEVFHLVIGDPGGYNPEAETAADLYALTLTRSMRVTPALLSSLAAAHLGLLG